MTMLDPPPPPSLAAQGPLSRQSSIPSNAATMSGILPRSLAFSLTASGDQSVFDIMMP